MIPFQEHNALPQAQQIIRDRCFHPTGPFVPFGEDWLQGSIVSRFEAQVTAGPDRLAIRSPTSEFTYGEVDGLATRLAATLLGRRGDVEEPVALVFEHDAPLVAAMLGVLKAGKFYVPLDPSYPSERLRYMLHDTEAAVVVSSRACLSVARELAGSERDVVCLDALDLEADAGAVTRPIAPERPALLLYTSGSTGRPKGFVQTHQNVLLDVMNYTNTLHYATEDRFVLVSSCGFADSIRTIYGSLLNGGSLLPFDLKRFGIQELSGWLTSQRITIYRSVPTVFRHFVRMLSGAEAFDDLRLIVLAGEPVLRRDVELFQRHFSETCILINRIGTGEALSYACYFVDRHTTVDGTNVPVGFPLPGKEILLLDESGREIDGPGVGDMVVRSRFMSPGYWRRPDPDGGRVFGRAGRRGPAGVPHRRPLRAVARRLPGPLGPTGLPGEDPGTPNRDGRDRHGARGTSGNRGCGGRGAARRRWRSAARGLTSPSPPRTHPRQPTCVSSLRRNSLTPCCRPPTKCSNRCRTRPAGRWTAARSRLRAPTHSRPTGSPRRHPRHLSRPRSPPSGVRCSVSNAWVATSTSSIWAETRSEPCE